MKIKTSELTGIALDWAVAKSEGKNPNTKRDTPRKYKLAGGWREGDGFGKVIESYSSYWKHGGPIIEREKISILEAGEIWGARPLQDGVTPIRDSFGPTTLIAAMRCYVRSKLGDEIDIPEELLQ